MVVFGIFVILLGSAQLKLGVPVYKSFSRQDNWSIATVISGLLFILVGFLPIAWVEKFVKAQIRGTKYKHR